MFSASAFPSLPKLLAVAAAQGQLKTTADIQRIAALQPRCPTISILDTARPATNAVIFKIKRSCKKDPNLLLTMSRM